MKSKSRIAARSRSKQDGPAMLTIVVPSLPVAALRAAIKSISATDLTARERIAAFKVLEAAQHSQPPTSITNCTFTTGPRRAA
jgi:hypothetical protein